MKKNNWKWAVLFSGVYSLSALAITPEAGTQRPAPENYASYSLYLQALFDFQRASNAGSPKQTSTGSAEQESLEQAIAHAGSNPPGSVDIGTKPRSTFKSFALNQIPAQDMSQTSVDNALGIFSDHAMQQQPQTTARLRPDNALSLFGDEEISLLADANNLIWQYQSERSVNDFSGHITLPEGEADASASAHIGEEKGSLDLKLSSKVRSNVYITDRSGIAGSRNHKNAGAIALQPIALEIRDLTAHITTPVNSRGDRLIEIESSSPRAIIVDLSGSRIGAANAKNSSPRLALSKEDIGPISYLARLGPDALLTIAPGMQLNIRLDRPDGLLRPFASLNGKISDISVGDITILGKNASADSEGGIHIGRLRVSGLNLVNAGLFINGESIVLDMGSGIRNMSIAIERLAMGTGPNAFIGDLYTDNIGIANTHVTIAAH